ncbi:MAG: hypothetical protein R3A10_11795 [Caldilineaceae bacterium]
MTGLHACTEAAGLPVNMWRVLLNGKDISYLDGPATAPSGDEIHIFPPGRCRTEPGKPGRRPNLQKERVWRPTPTRKQPSSS